VTGFEPDFSANFRNWTDRPPQARKFSGCGLEIKEIDVKSDRPIGQFLPQFQKSDRPPSRTRFLSLHPWLYTAAGKGEGRDSKKAMFIVAWVKQYASEVTEKLPDATQVLLPRQAWTSMHEEFQNDMKAAGCETSAQIASFTYFRDVFKTSPELSGIEMTRFKGNFNKCAKCISLTGRVMNALKAHDAAAHADAKVERLEHYMEARAGKVHYYGQRAASRSACAVKLTLIVDKMDSAKNHIPWFSNGRKPKDVDALLSDVLKLHITGVIIHGRPDARYIFYSYPHLPGNANLNIECVRRALLHYSPVQ
jgi:hypothetical protein